MKRQAAVTRPTASAACSSLAEHLRDGPLKTIAELQARAAALARNAKVDDGEYPLELAELVLLAQRNCSRALDDAVHVDAGSADLSHSASDDARCRILGKQSLAGASLGRSVPREAADPRLARSGPPHRENRGSRVRSSQ
jgi:hypothetical protein